MGVRVWPFVRGPFDAGSRAAADLAAGGLVVIGSIGPELKTDELDLRVERPAHRLVSRASRKKGCQKHKDS